MLDRNPTLPLYQSLLLRKNNYILFFSFFLCPFALSCPPLGRERGGGIYWGGEGVDGKCEMMMMDDDDDDHFLHSLYNGILRARG